MSSITSGSQNICVHIKPILTYSLCARFCYRPYANCKLYPISNGINIALHVCNNKLLAWQCLCAMMIWLLCYATRFAYKASIHTTEWTKVVSFELNQKLIKIINNRTSAEVATTTYAIFAAWKDAFSLNCCHISVSLHFGIKKTLLHPK